MTSKTTLMLGAVLVAVTAGCSVTPDYPNEEFGSSVRQMVQQQTYDPAAAANPAEGIQGPLQGEKAASAMDGYRKGRGPASESDAAAKLNASISGTATQ